MRIAIAGERNENDNADLREEIVAEAAQPERQHRPEQSDRNREQHGERHAEALIKRHQEQIGERDRDAEYVNRLSRRLLLLQRRAGPFEGVAGSSTFCHACSIAASASPELRPGSAVPLKLMARRLL